MTEFGDSNVRIWDTGQTRRLLDVHLYVADSLSTPELLKELATRIGDIIDVKVAFVGKRSGTWTVLAESRAEPAVLPHGDESWSRIDRIATLFRVECVKQREVEWTVIGFTNRSNGPTLMMLEGDWTRSAPTMMQLARNLLFAERAFTLSRHAQVGVAAQRLSRALARVSGMPEVCQAVLRHMVREVPSRLAAFAVPLGGDERLAIVATEGYPLALVEHLRIDPGVGVIGSVYRDAVPLRVPDVTVFRGSRGRSRYRTNSFVALPITAGSSVLGVVCITDRADDLAFTRDDLSRFRALAAPTALALARERVRAEAESYAHAAVIDPLSGLFNRRYFQARLDEELQRASRHKMPVALVMADIDDFKRINDRFGHLVGDSVITDVADILRRSVRLFDVCTRFGGEEFAIVMPGTGADGAANIAERIRRRIEEHRFSAGDDLAGLPVTVSVGLAASSANISARELIEQADAALYTAKRAGKNQVRRGTPEDLQSPPLLPGIRTSGGPEGRTTPGQPPA